MACLDTHNRVRMRIERCGSVEDVDRNGIGLYPFRPAGKGLLHDISEKGPHTIRRVEFRTSQNPLELGPYRCGIDLSIVTARRIERAPLRCGVRQLVFTQSVLHRRSLC